MYIMIRTTEDLINFLDRIEKTHHILIKRVSTDSDRSIIDLATDIPNIIHQEDFEIDLHLNLYKKED